MTRKGDTLGYARVSTADQDLSGQTNRLKDAGAIRVFEDVVSGKQFDRPGLTSLLDHARPGDSLAITRLDRLGRSLRELIETVENLKARSIGLISLEEHIDTISAAGELIFHVFGAFDHFERHLISERTKDAPSHRATATQPGIQYWTVTDHKWNRRIKTGWHPRILTQRVSNAKTCPP